MYIWSATTLCSSMGWLRSVASIKLHVSFAEYRLLYRSLLQKRPIILSILLTKATPQCHTRCIIYIFIYALLLPPEAPTPVPSIRLRLQHALPLTHRQGVLISCSRPGHFPKKSPLISGSFAKNDLQLKET